MFKALNTAATGMQAQQTNMDVIANNMANVSTTGFKKSRAEFEDLMYQTSKEPGAQTSANSFSPTGVQTGTGVRTSSVQKNFETGNAKITRGPLDVMVEGPGFFPVLLQDGQVGYTRDGSFKKDTEGRIVDRNGHALQPEIVIPPNATSLEIAPNGQVRVMMPGDIVPQDIGQVQLVKFVNPGGLRALGKNLFFPTGASGLPNEGLPGQNGFGALAQGQLEASNVNIVDEMVNMITAQRAYETNSKVIMSADQMLQSATNLR